GASVLDVEELRQITMDIDRDGRHAGDVVDRLRSMMKRQPMEFRRVDVESLLLDVISLIRTDAVARGVMLEMTIETRPLAVRGDRVHLSQVLINLIINAMDATDGMPPARRHVIVQAHAADESCIELAVADYGIG